MTIEEAIKRYTSNAEYEYTHGNLQGCLEEFRQLAEWLKDYKRLKEQESCEMTAKEADNVKNSRLAIEAMHKQSCESYKFCKSCEDIAMAFQIGLLFGKADKAIEEVKKTVTPQPCDDVVSRQAGISTIYDNKSDFKNDFAQGFFADKIKGLPPVTIQPNKWIPCSERLPEIHQDVILSLRSLDVEVGYRAETEPYFYCHGADGCYIDPKNILAWMPLPEPYKQEVEE